MEIKRISGDDARALGDQDKERTSGNTTSYDASATCCAREAGM